MLQVVDLSKRLIDEMTRMPKEQYVNSADAHSMMMGLGSGSGPGTGRERRATLGVIPTYGEDEQSVKGVKISGTTDGSPAAKAGLKENDVLVGWNGKALDNLMDLSTALAESKPGDKIKVKLLRDGKPIEIEATLAERK
jgi:S1-C subfamily serine protease